MTIFGLKLAKWKQWIEVLKAERRSINVRQVLSLGVDLLLRFDRKLFLARYRQCWRCPVFNRPTRQCRRGALGCGCWMVLKAGIPKATCWAKDQNPTGTIGWSNR